ncbi:MAG: ribosome modulation factor [Janthinobacterium lividum]
MPDMSQNPGLPTSAHSLIVTVLDGVISGFWWLAGCLWDKTPEPETPAEMQAYNEGWDAGIHSEFSAECPYGREELAEQWHKGFGSGNANAW